jgi:hypothetical protein
MKAFFLTTMTVLFLLCFTLGIQAQTSQTQPAVISFGTRDFINSKILNEQREVWVYVPGSASDTTYSKQSYPVVYLLDADWNFSSVVGMIEFLSSNYSCPEMIVVGIPNVNIRRSTSFFSSSG